MGKAKLYINKILSYMDAQGIRGKIPFFVILIDVVWCTLIYGATISDYFFFRFYKKRHCDRNTFMTARDKDRFYKAMNNVDNDTRKIVQNKDIFNEKFAEYLKRDCISVPECGEQAFCDFLNTHEAVFIKPVATGGGAGIVKTSADKIGDVGAYYAQLCSEGTFVVEAGIVQHPDMAKIHPESVNTVRFSTLYDGEKVNILFVCLRCGTGDSYMDNHMMGGVVMNVDPETGRVTSRASGKRYLQQERHPDTGVLFPGFQIPHWDKCLALIDEVARKTGGIRYVGWDIAVLKDDICLIEANPSGDFNIYQEPTQTGCKAEMDAWIEKIQKTGEI